MTPSEIAAWLEQRVREEEGCLVWTMGVNSGGHPIASVDGKRSRAVRPWLYERLGGSLCGRRIVAACGNDRCMNRKHWKALLPGQINRLMVREGRFVTQRRRAALLRNGLMNSPYSDAQVAEARRLRAEGLTLVRIQERTGIPFSSVSKFCRGERRRPTLPAASVFSWAGSTPIGDSQA